MLRVERGPRQSFNLAYRFAFPKLVPVVKRGERAGVHPIDIESPAQVVDLVLQDARVPSRCFKCFFHSTFVQKFHSDGARSGNKGGKTRQAEAPLEKLHRITSHFRNSGIDDGVKRHGPPVAFSKLLCWKVLVVFLAVLDHSELQGKADLGSGKPYARGVIHGLSHRLDQVLNFLACNLSGGQRTSLLPQDRIPGLHDLEFHADLDSRAHRPSACAVQEIWILTTGILAESGKFEENS